jgi:hypothetical protein
MARYNDTVAGAAAMFQHPIAALVAEMLFLNKQIAEDEIKLDAAAIIFFYEASE